MTFLAALRCDRIEASCVVDGPINGLTFGLYIERFLLPTLKPGDVVIMDNLASHKSPFVRKTIRIAVTFGTFRRHMTVDREQRCQVRQTDQDTLHADSVDRIEYRRRLADANAITAPG